MHGGLVYVRYYQRPKPTGQAKYLKLTDIQNLLLFPTHESVWSFVVISSIYVIEFIATTSCYALNQTGRAGINLIDNNFKIQVEEIYNIQNSNTT